MRHAIAVLVLVASGCVAPGAPVSPSLGSIVTKDHVVVIVQTPDGIRYSVEDPSGEEVATGLTRDELLASYPDLARRIDSSTASPTMADVSR